MDNPEESQLCGVCADFEPQAWRKSLCRNCFHSLDEHSEEMLAAEAEAAAKEKKEDRKSPKSDDKSEPKKVPSGDPKAKSKATPAPLSKPAGTTPNVTTKGKEQATSSSTTTGTTTSTPSSSSNLSKPSHKASTIPTSKTSSLSSASSQTSQCSPTSSKSAPSSSGPHKSSTASKPSPSLPSTTSAPSTSKAKSLTSKFENKTLEVKDTKSIPKSSPSVPSKLKATDSNNAGKAEETKSSSSTASKLASPSKTGGGKDAKTTNEKSRTLEGSSEKSKVGDSYLAGKGTKDAKIPTGRTKNVAPFGKDMLKSTKEAIKKEKDDVSNLKSNDTEQKSKFDSLKRGSAVKETGSGDNKKRTTESSPSKSESTDKLTTLPSSVKKGGNGESTPGKVGSSTTHRVDPNCKLPEDHGNSRGAREIDKPGTGKINDASGQTSKPVNNEKEAEKRHGVAEKGDNLKQKVEKSGKTNEGEQKGAQVPKWQPDAKGKFQNSSDDAVLEPSTKNGLSSYDVSSRDSRSQKENERGKDANKIDKQPVTSVSQAVSVVTTVSKTETSVTVSLPSTSESSSISTSTSSSSVSSSSSSSNLPQKSAPSRKLENGDKEQSIPSPASLHGRGNDKGTKKLSEELKRKEEKVAFLENKLSKMEKKLKTLEQENDAAPKAKNTTQDQKDEMERLLKSLRDQVAQMEQQCSKLETDNSALKKCLQEQEKSVKRDQESRGKTEDNTDLERDLERTEDELDEVKEENSELRREIMELKNEMDEMYDTFRENEHDEFRELQKELDMTAKNCRILQFKLRKAERRNEQIEEDRVHYEEKLRHLQDQFDSADAKNHIRILEEELRVAKEVSVRLHDELDIIEDKKNKALEDNKHLTELLEHTDKRQFRMEMEIDKLREMVADLKQQLKEEKSRSGKNDSNCNNNNDANKDASPERKILSAIYTRSVD